MPRRPTSTFALTAPPATSSAAPSLALIAAPADIFYSRFHSQAADTLDPGHDHELPGAEEDEHSQHGHVVFVGPGARVRVLPTAYVVGEYSPRLAGWDPDAANRIAAIE